MKIRVQMKSCLLLKWSRCSAYWGASRMLSWLTAEILLFINTQKLKISSRSIAQNVVWVLNLPCRATKFTVQRLLVNSCILSVSLSCPQGLVGAVNTQDCNLKHWESSRLLYLWSLVLTTHKHNRCTVLTTALPRNINIALMLALWHGLLIVY
jgi:hypothetical protein